MGRRVKEVGFRVYGLEIRVEGSGFEVWGLGFRVCGVDLWSKLGTHKTARALFWPWPQGKSV